MPVFSVHVFNVKLILFIINYVVIRKRMMLTINIPNRMPKTGNVFTGICIGYVTASLTDAILKNMKSCFLLLFVSKN